MTIKTICKQNEIYITVIGELEDSNQIGELAKLLSISENKNFNVTFLGANIIHRSIIEKLFILQEHKKCNIFVLKRYLFSYLQYLGIKCSYITEDLTFRKLKDNLSYEKEKPSHEEIYIFLKDLNNIYGYDYTEYQIDSIMRRINIAMIRERIHDFSVFREQVLNNREIFYDLFLDLSINTTEFFRNHEVFNMIKNKILPYLNSYNHIKIWCAGCSIGKEVYSLAIILKEANMLGKTQIYATDINPYAIEEAKNGLYSITTLDKDIDNYRNAQGEKSFIQYFDVNKNYIKVKNELKKNILFFQHSLLSSGTLNEFNLILCRNVFIYFNDSLKEKVLKNFYNSLDNNGFLVLGKSERIQERNGHNYFYKYDDQNKIYRKMNK
ncbi:CheR family methyltransferase [Clostridium arbusti]|uniref:CheR family methyltransferase n=1 Tax=Clostridium arbusti TaxID=1137848 RepID=UPI0002882C2E|nr:protein-glutamate O-methyltransferase CheR [Clostridium arbusti]